MFTKDGGDEGGKQMDHRPSSPCAGGGRRRVAYSSGVLVVALLAREEAFTWPVSWCAPVETYSSVSLSRDYLSEIPRLQL
jgi:hypothetical protein